MHRDEGKENMIYGISTLHTIVLCRNVARTKGGFLLSLHISLPPGMFSFSINVLQSFLLPFWSSPAASYASAAVTKHSALSLIGDHELLVCLLSLAAAEKKLQGTSLSVEALLGFSSQYRHTCSCRWERWMGTNVCETCSMHSLVHAHTHTYIHMGGYLHLQDEDFVLSRPSYFAPIFLEELLTDVQSVCLAFTGHTDLTELLPVKKEGQKEAMCDFKKHPCGLNQRSTSSAFCFLQWPVSCSGGTSKYTGCHSLCLSPVIVIICLWI